MCLFLMLWEVSVLNRAGVMLLPIPGLGPGLLTVPVLTRAPELCSSIRTPGTFLLYVAALGRRTWEEVPVAYRLCVP